MKKILLFSLIIITEVVLCVVLFINYNTKKYSLWNEKQVTISDVVITGQGAAYRSNMSSLNSVSINYNDDIVILDLYNYNFKYRRNDNITIKYNPENPKEIIYQPYEEYCVKKKRIKTVIVFVIIISATLFFYRLKMEKE